MATSPRVLSAGVLLSWALLGQAAFADPEAFAPSADQVEDIERLSQLLAHRTDLFAKEEVMHLAITMVRTAERHDLDPLLLLAMIEVESSYRRRGESPVGALGLMQLMPTTAAAFAKHAGVRWRGPRSLFEPDTNIEIGAAYLAYLIETFDGRHDLALAAYCHGPTAIRRLLRSSGWLDRELGYGRKVMDVWRSLRSTATADLPATG